MNTRHSASLVVLAFMGMVTTARSAPPPIDGAKPGQWVFERTSTSCVTTGDVTFWTTGEMFQLSMTSFITTKTTYRLTWVDRVEGPRIILKRQEVSADLKTGLGPTNELVFNRGDEVEAPGGEMSSMLTTDESIAIEGDEIPLGCKRVEVVVLDGGRWLRHTVRWTSDQVPLFGLVKTVRLHRDGVEIDRTELLRWGESGGAEKPIAEKPIADKP